MSCGYISDDYLRKYLLDEIPPSSRVALEELYLSDDSLHERLLAIEEELIDQLFHGLLSPSQSNYLNKKLRISKDGLARLAFAQALAQLRKQRRQDFPADVWLRWTKWRMFISAVVGATVLLAFVGFRRNFHLERIGSTNNGKSRVADPMSANPRMPDLPSNTLTLLLGPVRRDNSLVNVLQIPKGRCRILLEAELDKDSERSLQATVQPVAGGPIQTSTDITKRKAQSGTILVSAGFNSELFEDGDYIFTILMQTERHSSEEVAAYLFSVVHGFPSR